MSAAGDVFDGVPSDAVVRESKGRCALGLLLLLGLASASGCDGTPGNMGQGVVPDGSTDIGDEVRDGRLIGEVFEVSGPRDAASSILASCVERREGSDACRGSGPARHVDADATTLEVQSLVVGNETRAGLASDSRVKAEGGVLAVGATDLVGEGVAGEDYRDGPDRVAEGRAPGGCDDAHDDDGRISDNLRSPVVLPPGASRIDRSLCGFYDADFIEFTALAGSRYRIEVLEHQSPGTFGVYLQLLERGEDGALGLVRQTSPGEVVLDYTTTAGGERAHVVRVASTASDIGGYGGGDYTLSIESER